MTPSTKIGVALLLASVSVAPGMIQSQVRAAPSPATPTGCQTLRKHGRQSEAQACFEALTRSNSPYFRAEGYWGLEQYEQANEEFRIATSQEDGNALYRVRWGMLLHERFNDTDAAGLFNEALKRDPRNAQAYLGLARISEEDFDGTAAGYAAKALTLDPKLVEAHELLADVALANSDNAEAIAQADQAIAMAPDALDAMAIHAAVEVLADRSPDAWFDKIHQINPGYGEGYAIVARQLQLHYRYEDATAYYRKAIAANPHLWSARSELGINLMRLGQQDEPYQQLEMCYDNGYRDAATVNSLRLLDSYKNFTTYRDATTILRLNSKEADLLRPYFEAELRSAIETYSKKYKMTLPGPVQVEVYPDHEDFAVRTTGMPGLGAEGVTFGEVVAMDSPSARKPGDFNWGSTLWHEMSHVFILTATNNRVPRWFTEGLAVHEEGAASSEWAERPSPDVLAAIRDKKLLPVLQLDRGFVFPQYPSQVLVSYFQAGSICDYISNRWGEGKLLDIVHSYAQMKTTEQIIQQDLGISPEEFDKQYLQWLDGKYGATAANFDQWRKGLENLVQLDREKQYDAVLKDGEAVLQMYPEYVGAANAYELLVDADLAKDDKKSAAAVLAGYEEMGGQDPAVLKKLASLDQELGQPKAAAATLDRINYIYPEDEDLHRQLGSLYLQQQNYPNAIREYTAVLALNPLDKAGANFDLARAYFAAGKRDKAEDSVLKSLEIAPGFEPAQKLLLELQPQQDKDSTKPN